MSETSGQNTGIYLIYSRPHFPIILESLIVPSTLYLHPLDLRHYCSTIFLLKNKKVSIRLLGIDYAAGLQRNLSEHYRY
jgi:hypothetical protein